LTAKQLQKSKFHYTRSGEYEKVLLSLYPDLNDRIAQEKQAKIDSIVLLNKYSESLPKGASSFRAGSFNQYSYQTPSKPKRRRSSGGFPSPSSTPALEGNEIQPSEMIFDMEDDDTNEVAIDSKNPMNQSPLPQLTSSAKRQVAPAKGKQRAFSDSNLSEVSFESNTMDDSSFKLQVWDSDKPFENDKLTLKDIMEQASSNRSSNLTSGLTSRSVSGPATHAKVSQKERKKLQHEASINPTRVASFTAPTTSKGSPWKTISKSKPRSVDETSPAPSPSAPQLTMRQTIANPSSKTSQQKKPIKHTPPAKPEAPLTPSSTPIVEIKSVRHTPMPMRSINPTEFASLTDILSQQQADKSRARGGGEKHNLADIQTEQEFQQWWDQESARIQEEEKAQSQKDERVKSRKKPNRYRGKSHGGKPKDKVKSASNSSAKQ
jgi:hypothetical protein